MVSFSNADGVLEVRHRHEVIRIEAWGADSVRVRAAQHRVPDRSEGALDEAPPAGPPGKVSINGTHASLTSGRLRPWSARLFYAYADALLAAGRT